MITNLGLCILAWTGLFLTSRVGEEQPKSLPPSAAVSGSAAVAATQFQVGVAERDITPDAAMPMWGYGARHDRLSEGVLDPLKAKAVVIQAGTAKLAIVAMDLGRGPTTAMLERVRTRTAASGIAHVLICGSHTHHGPVIELTDRQGCGKGKFDAAVAYNRQLPEHIEAVILEADRNRQPARIGTSFRDLTLNRNRHTKRPNPPTDPRMTVIRFDRTDGSPIAFLVHYIAHPVLTPGQVLKFSADYPGFLRARVESELHAPCMFIQGAAGDQSANPPAGSRDPKAYGELLGGHAVELARQIVTAAPRTPALSASVDRFHFATRINLKSPITFLLYAKAFFPELIQNVLGEFAEGMDPELSTVLLNRELAIVGMPGEPFSQHAVRFRERAYIPNALVFGYCNGHFLYFPTIEAASEGGYGADSRVSPIALGAGEDMMNRALLNVYRLLGKFEGEPASASKEPASRQSPSASTSSGSRR